MNDVPRRVGRPGGAPPPRAASPAIAVVVTLVAAVLGFFILRSLDDDSSGGTASPGTDATTTSLGTETTPTVAAVTTTIDKSTFQLLVANASGVQGSAATLTADLQSRGYRTLTAANTVPGYGPRDVTEVFYLAGFEAQAADVARSLGVQALPMPATKPVSDTDFVGATVLVALGTDLAAGPPAADGAATTAAAATGETIAGSPNDTTTTTAG
jgi:LytR cell envelope-related transcriptional attenuator